VGRRCRAIAIWRRLLRLRNGWKSRHLMQANSQHTDGEDLCRLRSYSRVKVVDIAETREEDEKEEDSRLTDGGCRWQQDWDSRSVQVGSRLVDAVCLQVGEATEEVGAGPGLDGEGT
jgi:hypothetical protein